MLKGLWQHFSLTLRLNFRSARAIAYGYAMPVLFLFGFGSVFRAGEPALLAQMGQILTITLLGGACLGMPTALVAERERGVWQRYRLLPVPVSALLANVLLVRVVLVGLGVLLQMALAHLVYGTPWPAHPLQLGLGFLAVTVSFLGLGLMVAALADDVPAVQALGQCIFLPMILLGGVGVPLEVLPAWAQSVASFMPGRYSVEVLQACYGGAGLGAVPFSLLALLVIGAAAIVAGARLQPWEAGGRLGRRTAVAVLVALGSWAAVGLVALSIGRSAPVPLAPGGDWTTVTEEAIASLSFSGLPDDDGFYAPLAPPLRGERFPPRLEELSPRLERWPPARRGHPGQQVRTLLSVAAIADITQDPSERLVARIVYRHLRERFDDATLTRALAWVSLAPEAGTVVTAAPELGLRGKVDPGIVRERSDWYARKFLGRVLGIIPDEPPAADS
ncbi:MAG: ABC transporter permease [Opitutales bacterium]